jgi:hypothetical protein
MLNKELAKIKSIEKNKKTIHDENLERFYSKKIKEIKKHLFYE